MLPWITIYAHPCIHVQTPLQVKFPELLPHLFFLEHFYLPSDTHGPESQTLRGMSRELQEDVCFLYSTGSILRVQIPPIFTLYCHRINKQKNRWCSNLGLLRNSGRQPFTKKYTPSLGTNYCLPLWNLYLYTIQKWVTRTVRGCKAHSIVQKSTLLYTTHSAIPFFQADCLKKSLEHVCINCVLTLLILILLSL